uniref:GH18 domain-containing protein n=1 Tax=Amblyomma maculatum TaxID=34609 RepID=G3MSZ2_AMBMU
MTPMAKQNQGFLIVSYYSWDKSNLRPEGIDTSLCTHLILGFTDVEDSVLSKGSTDGEPSYNAVAGLKAKNPLLKVMLSVGGGCRSHSFHSMVSDPSNTDRFVASVVETLRGNNLDGIDIDWEFPMDIRNGKAHFTRLLQKLRTAFDDEAKASGRQALILSAAVAAQSMLVKASYDIPEIERYVDFINLMTYDLHLFKWYYPFSGHNSPLYGRRREIGYFATLNMASSAEFWFSRGMPKAKIIVGIPTYGLVWKLCHRIWHGVSCLTVGKGREGGGYISYPEVCKVISNGGKRIFDKQSKVPYVIDKNNWISYDDVTSVELKARWILSEGFGGIMTFSLNCDDHTGTVSPEGVRFPLHKKIKEVVEQGIKA